MEKVIIVDNKKLHLLLANSLDYSEIETLVDEETWDFLLEELLDGTIEINEDIWYLYENGRCYETNKEVIN